jgi:hypothetical protein
MTWCRARPGLCPAGQCGGGPRAPRASQRSMQRVRPALLAADRYQAGQDPIHQCRPAQPATHRGAWCQGCQDPMHQFASIGCVPVAGVTVSRMAKRDASETACYAGRSAFPVGRAMHRMEPAPAPVSVDAPPSRETRNETGARRRWAGTVARRPTGHAGLVRRVRGRRGGPIALTLNAARLDPRAKRPGACPRVKRRGACLSRSRGRG